jgi:serine/threonine protein kinase
MPAQFPDGDLSRFLPEGRSLRDLPSELVEEQRSITFLPGKIISARFEIQEELGFGGIGAIYRVKDRLLYGHPCALKIILPSLVRSYEAREHFLAEANMARALRHENCVTVYDLGEDKHEDVLFLSMELLEGSSLADFLKTREGKISFNEAYDIILQICDALRYAHGKGIIHGGIKPQNVFILPSGKVKLLDFGLSRLLGPGKLTRFSIGFGIDRYMAPEQSAGKDMDVRTDIFALGVVFYHMLVMQDQMSGSRWPTGIEMVIKNCLKPQPEQRYQNISELVQEIEKIRKESAEGSREDDGETIIEKAQETERAIIVQKYPVEGQGGEFSGKRKKKKLVRALMVSTLILLSAGLFTYIAGNKPWRFLHVNSETQTGVTDFLKKNSSPQVYEKVPAVIEEQGLDNHEEPVPPLDPQQEEHIERLLAQAERQITSRRYTSPVRDNAFITLKEVLARDRT